MLIPAFLVPHAVLSFDKSASTSLLSWHLEISRLNRSDFLQRSTLTFLDANGLFENHQEGKTAGLSELPPYNFKRKSCPTK
jgi:hypothetical protein